MILRRKKILCVIVFFLLIFGCGAQSYAQFNSFGGELKFESQYQDVLNVNMYSSSFRRNPMFAINTSGDIFSPRLFYFTARTTINGNYSNSRNGDNFYNIKQYFWDYYNVDVAMFQYAPLKLNLSAREGAFSSESQYSVTKHFSNSRRQEQRISLATHQFPFLPTTTVAFQSSRSWALGTDPYDLRSQQFSAGISASRGNSSMSMSSSLSKMNDIYANTTEQYYTVMFQGSQEISDFQKLDVSSEYYRYVGFSSLSGSALYTATLNSQLGISTNVSGNAASGTSYSSTSLGAAQLIQFIQDENFRYNANYSFKTSQEVYDNNGTKAPFNSSDWNAGIGASHGRSLGFASISNSISGSFSSQNSIVERRTFGGNFSNSMKATIHRFTISANHGLSGDVVLAKSNRYHIGNQARLTLDGSLFGKFHSHTNADFRNERFYGAISSFNTRKHLQVQQTLRTSFYYSIPFTISFGGSSSWMFTKNIGNTYGWNVNFTSSSFFVSALTANYRYSRSFDPYYIRHAIEQNAEFTYRFRALSFQLRLRSFQLTERRREIWFSVRRPF